MKLNKDGLLPFRIAIEMAVAQINLQLPEYLIFVIIPDMNASEYKIICQRPDVFSRYVIEQTSWLLPAGSLLKTRLHVTLNQEPIQKPDLYTGESNNDYRKINLPIVDAEEIADILLTLEAEAVSPSGETTSHTSFIAGLVDAWNSYIEAMVDARDIN